MGRGRNYWKLQQKRREIAALVNHQQWKSCGEKAQLTFFVFSPIIAAVSWGKDGREARTIGTLKDNKRWKVTEEKEKEKTGAVSLCWGELQWEQQLGQLNPGPSAANCINCINCETLGVAAKSLSTTCYSYFPLGSPGSAAEEQDPREGAGMKSQHIQAWHPQLWDLGHTR